LFKRLEKEGVDMGIHNDKREIEFYLKKIDNSEISKKNKDIVLKFMDECYSRGLSDTRVLFYVSRLWVILSRWTEMNLDELNKEDIKSLVRRIETSDYTEWTKQNYKVTIKKVIQLLGGYEWDSKEYPESVKWIKLSIKNNRKRLPEEILTEEEIKKMIKIASNIRDKALVAVLYESGCRIGELLGTRLKNVQFDEFGAVLFVYGKTGSRRVRLIFSVPHLLNWVNNHPFKDNHESFLWTTIIARSDGRMLSYAKVRLTLRDLAKKSGISKLVNPHSFRHARATHLAMILSEAQMKEFFGWTQSSEMASIYVHLSGRDVDNAILKAYGKLPKEEAEKEKEMKLKQCPRCSFENSPELDFCGRCGLPLDLKTALESKEKEKEFMKLVTPDIIEQLIEKKVQEILKRTTNL
jgi:integrase